MKKLFLTMAVALMGLATASAQLVVGGGLRIGGTASSVSKVDGEITSKTPDNFYFGISPKVGYVMKDGKLEVGAIVSLQYNHSTSFDDTHKFAKDFRNYGVSLFVDPYVRYYFLQKGIFSLGIEGVVGLGGWFDVASKYYAIDGYRTADEAKEMAKAQKQAIKDSKPVNFSYGISVRPVMLFNINEHWCVDITVDALGLYLGGSYSKSEQDLGSGIVKVENNNFNGGLQMFSSQNGIAIGAAYKF